MRWAGVDVGGRRKGFHVALIEQDGTALRLVEPLARGEPLPRVVAYLVDAAPAVIAVDSPISVAPPGARSRQGERQLAHAVCGIRYTPDLDTIRGHPGSYYEWIEHGLELYAQLAQHLADTTVIECFPTASWTRLGGRRTGKRTAWSQRLLVEELVSPGRLRSVPPRTSQDDRDALVAAFTAYLHSHGQTEAFAELIVPRQRSGR